MPASIPRSPRRSAPPCRPRAGRRRGRGVTPPWGPRAGAGTHLWAWRCFAFIGRTLAAAPRWIPAWSPASTTSPTARCRGHRRPGPPHRLCHEVNTWFAEGGWDALIITPPPRSLPSRSPASVLSHWPHHDWDCLSGGIHTIPSTSPMARPSRCPCGRSGEGLPIGLQIAGRAARSEDDAHRGVFLRARSFSPAFASL